MKQINGIPINIESDILGRITLKGKNIFNRKDEILVKANATSVPSGYLALITDGETINGDKPCVGNVKKLDEFKWKSRVRARYINSAMREERPAIR